MAALVCGVLFLCAGLVGGLFAGGGSDAGCAPTAPSGGHPPGRPSTLGGPFTSIGAWDGDQVGNAATIIAVGLSRGLPARAWVIAVATAMQESSLRNMSGGDRDSVGVFQQRPSQGWGTVVQLMDPVQAAGKFYDRLLTVPAWQMLPLAEAAQAVQRSTYPDAYARWEGEATTIVATLTGAGPGFGGCAAVLSRGGWTRPVHGPVVSGFRTAGRPTHHGVDIGVGKGTPIHAASAGTVATVRCNATGPDGRPYGCDRDGSPQVRGCGWYVDIQHAGGVLTRYCHQLVHPFVTLGQTVVAGHVIGISGTSGNSSGPHLHYEVHLGDHTSATATDPVPFMATVGAPLETREAAAGTRRRQDRRKRDPGSLSASYWRRNHHDHRCGPTRPTGPRCARHANTNTQIRRPSADYETALPRPATETRKPRSDGRQSTTQ